MKTTICFLLDETGSMAARKPQTISGFNEYINTLKGRDDVEDIEFSLAKFNSDWVGVVYVGPLKEAKELTDKDYTPNFNTPLYDAVGRTVHELEKKVSDERVLFIIMTDGEENDSREFDRDGILKLIKEKEDKNWSFVYMGVNQDVWQDSRKIGVSKGNTANYMSQGTNDPLSQMRVTTSSTQNYLNSTKKKTGTFWEDKPDD